MFARSQTPSSRVRRSSDSSESNSSTHDSASPSSAPLEVDSVLGLKHDLPSILTPPRFGSVEPLSSKSAKSIRRSVPQSRRGFSCVSRLFWLVMLTTMSVALLWAVKWGQPSKLPPLRLDTTARYLARHTGHTLQIAKDLESLSYFYRDSQISIASDSAHVIAEAVSGHSWKAAAALRIASDKMKDISLAQGRPSVFTGAIIWQMAATFDSISRDLRQTLYSDKRDVEAEKGIREYVDMYWVYMFPIMLGNLQTILDEARGRCEVVLHQEEQAMPELQRLQERLIPARPSWVHWWQRRKWDRDGSRRLRERFLRETVEGFNTVRVLKEMIEKTSEHLAEYRAEDLFGDVDKYPSHSYLTSRQITVPEYLELIAKPLAELQKLCREAQYRTV